MKLDGQRLSGFLCFWEVEKMIRSWWKRTMVLLVAILAAAGLFFGWTSYSYSQQLRKTIEEENANSVTLWANLTSSRLNTMYEHIYELLLTLYNNTELRTGTPIMDQWTKQTIVEMMEDKLLISDDVDTFFVYDTQNEFFLFAADPNRIAADALAIKKYARDNAVASAEAFRNLSWKVVNIEQKQYFFKSVRLGKYVVGATSNLDHYYIDDDFSVLGEDVSFHLLIDDTYYLCGGTEIPGGPTQSGNWIVVSGDVALLEGTALLSVHAGDLWDNSRMMQALLVLDSALCVILVVLLLIMLRRDVAAPTKALLRANHALADGNTAYRLDPQAASSSEFRVLYDSFNEMAEQIVQLRIQAYDMKIQESKNRLTMLRAQIRPHSFLNAITTISNMTYINKPEEIRSYINSFAKFIRYMLNVNSSWTTVEEETQQIINYLKMQQNRFPESVTFVVDCPAELSKKRIPFLMLYTLVENSIKHAMTLYEPMEVIIRCRQVETADFRGICLTEEDNGVGFPQDVLDKLQDARTNELNTKDHLGLSNVRYTMHLVYGRDDLLRVSNREGGGAHVELWIPDEEANHETSDL